MSDPNVPLSFVMQIAAIVFVAGGGWMMLRHLSIRQKEDRTRLGDELKRIDDRYDADDRENAERRVREAKEQGERREADRERAIERSKTERAEFRNELLDVIRVSAQARNDQLDQIVDDMNKITSAFQDHMKKTQDFWTTLSGEMRDQHWRIKNLEDDAKDAGWTRTSSSQRTPAAKRIEDQTQPKGHGQYGPKRPGFDPTVPR